MAHRGSRPGARTGRGQGRAKRGVRPRGKATTNDQKNGFKSARLPQTEDDLSADDALQTGSGSDSESDREVLDASEDDDNDEEDEEVSVPRQSYATLLQTLNTGRAQDEPPRKKRKTAPDATNGNTRKNSSNMMSKEDHLATSSNVMEPEADGEIENELADGNEIDDDLVAESVQDSEDEVMASHDPFESHFVGILEETLKSADARRKQKQVKDKLLTQGLRKHSLYYGTDSSPVLSSQSVDRLHIKSRLQKIASSVIRSFSAEQKDLFEEIANYRDIQYGQRTVENAPKLREMACLHALNHTFKTRDRVLKNNAKLNQHDTSDAPDLRDQGFTRPKILFIVPTKQACSRFVDTIAKLSEAEQQENKTRFWETYSQEDDESWQDKTEDFREVFGGNHEEDFRVGLKFTRKTIKYFSGFYNSDIIFGSALGLMRTITTGGGGSKDKKGGRDGDFLSSIEVVVIDHAAAIQMQNFQHLEYVLSQLNQIPKDSHGCDFARVRNWYLDGYAKQLRQTILFTSYHTPELNSLFSNHASNIAGLTKYTPVYHGSMLSLPPVLRAYSIPQTFLRFDSPTTTSDSDARFKFFATTILPYLLRHSNNHKSSSTNKGVMVFVPTYVDFVRLRNHLSTSNDTASLSFGVVSEYTPPKDTARARSHFASGRHSVLVYSERAHHHFRYRIRGVRRLIFYGVPENPIFWSELVGLLGLGRDAAELDSVIGGSNSGSSNSSGGVKTGIVRALFSRWDILKLERIVGTERVQRMIHDRGGDTFEFV